MKNLVKYLLQKVFGFRRYLLFFSLYSTKRALRGKYEKEFEAFLNLIPDEDIVLDVGANIGITAIAMATRRPNSVVHAYEPIWENYETLKKMMQIYRTSNIVSYNFALGNRDGKLKMIMPYEGKTRLQGLSKVYEEDSNEKARNMM